MTLYFICQADIHAPRLYSRQLKIECDFDTAMYHADMTHRHTGEPAWAELEDGTVVYETCPAG